jgi:hypothetical protein
MLWSGLGTTLPGAGGVLSIQRYRKNDFGKKHLARSSRRVIFKKVNIIISTRLMWAIPDENKR